MCSLEVAIEMSLLEVAIETPCRQVNMLEVVKVCLNELDADGLLQIRYMEWR